jgi:hypothetical protein
VDPLFKSNNFTLRFYSFIPFFISNVYCAVRIKELEEKNRALEAQVVKLREDLAKKK